MSARTVLVVRTGTANLASVLAAMRRLGACPQFTADLDEIRSANPLILPGVGTLAAARQQLEQQGLVQALQERVRSGRPTLAICLGLQLLFQGSQENPGIPGLGVFPGLAERFSDRVRVPQLGWNRVEPEPGCRWLTSGHAYFANSYKLPTAPPGARAAFSDHGGRFLAAFECGDLLACQFHPELSGGFGQALLRRWLTGVGGGAC